MVGSSSVRSTIPTIPGRSYDSSSSSPGSGADSGFDRNFPSFEFTRKFGMVLISGTLAGADGSTESQAMSSLSLSFLSSLSSLSVEGWPDLGSPLFRNPPSNRMLGIMLLFTRRAGASSVRACSVVALRPLDFREAERGVECLGCSCGLLTTGESLSLGPVSKEPPWATLCLSLGVVKVFCLAMDWAADFTSRTCSLIEDAASLMVVSKLSVFTSKTFCTQLHHLAI
mmetsp:Transcript_25000/g.57089  ORF Transcript_25000/g.57089 Transcript_25000/m.57089 type:complete len:227 (+) Transcript_25000:871-1551(+)